MPGDRAGITTHDKSSAGYQATQARMADVMTELSQRMRAGSVPWNSAGRYWGHMNAETLMPSILAYTFAMMWNPNNVALESSMATSQMEVEVGQDFAKLFGFEGGWGHLCSDGSLDAVNAQEALVSHLEARVPWHLRSTIDRVDVSQPFTGTLAGPAFDAMKSAMEESYGRPLVTQGQGGSIPLCNVLHQTFPEAEVMLYGVEEPQCLIHVPNESVSPTEIEHIALAEALFMRNFGSGTTQPSPRS